MTRQIALQPPPDTVSRFLWSIGKKDESDFYLGLFRAEAKERFAAIAVDSPVVAHALSALLGDIRFLTDLGLVPTVITGLLDSKEAVAQGQKVTEGLTQAGVKVRFISVTASDLADSVRATARQGVIPVVAFDAAAGHTSDERFRFLGTLIGKLQTRKVVFLQRRGGLSVEGQALGIVELGSDYARLKASSEVSRKQKTILTGVARLLEVLPHRCTFAMTSPLELPRELFTTRGSGTLIRRAARIASHADYTAIDKARLQELFESAFSRPLAPDFFQRPVSCLHLEEHYRGVAVVAQIELGSYLSKFAVDREAQGEGIGRDVWTALVAHHPCLFWRSRATNPVNSWYAKECDGMVRMGAWHVFWRGVPTERIPEAIAYSLGQPKDFPLTALGALKP